jgi:PAP2 superfamily
MEALMRLLRPEKFGFVLTFILMAICALLSYKKGMVVDIVNYDVAVTVDLFFLSLGLFYRYIRMNEAVARACVGIALLLLAGQVIPVFNYLMLPYRIFGVDQVLAQIDSYFGFVWADYATYMSQFPDFAAILKTVYKTSLWQCSLLLIVLGLFGKVQQVSRLGLAFIISGIVCIELWSLFPSSTPAAFQPLTADVLNRLHLTVDPEYGAKLVALSKTGSNFITPLTMLGMVGFPSFHTVMAVLFVYYSWSLKYLRIPAMALTALMLPAILLHGAHNLIDVFGGLAVAAFSIWFASKTASDDVAGEHAAAHWQPIGRKPKAIVAAVQE